MQFLIKLEFVDEKASDCKYCYSYYQYHIWLILAIGATRNQPEFIEIYPACLEDKCDLTTNLKCRYQFCPKKPS